MHNRSSIRSVPPIRPLSSLRQDQDAILSTVDQEPVILSQRGREHAALVSIEQWNQMVALLAMYQAQWRAEADRVQAANEYIHADTLPEALAIYREQPKIWIEAIRPIEPEAPESW